MYNTHFDEIGRFFDILRGDIITDNEIQWETGKKWIRKLD